MITTIYKCDKCGNEQTSKEQFWLVEIVVSAHKLLRQVSKYTEREIDVCRPCLESFGINVPDEKAKTLPPPTVEDLIREIITLVQE